MDPMRSGTIKTRQFVVAVIKSGVSGFNVSLQVDESNGSGPLEKVQEPYATYDAKFLHLAPPEGTGTERHSKNSVEDIEKAICDQVVQRTGKGTTLIQTLVRCFGDARDRLEKGAGITKDQVRYSLWTRFQMRVTDEEIEQLFAKYDKEKRGLLPLHAFIEGIIKNHAMSKALMEEAEVAGSYADDPNHDRSIDELLVIIKQTIMLNINRESRAPHYILHSSSRMRLDQFKSFITHKLRIEDSLIGNLTEIV